MNNKPNFDKVREVVNRKLKEAAKELGYDVDNIKGISYSDEQFSFKTNFIIDTKGLKQSKISSDNFRLQMHGSKFKIGDKVNVTFENQSKIYTLVGITKKGNGIIKNENGKQYRCKLDSLKKIGSNKPEETSDNNVINKEERNKQIIDSFKKGTSIRQIANEFNLSYARVSYLVKNS